MPIGIKNCDSCDEDDDCNSCDVNEGVTIGEVRRALQHVARAAQIAGRSFTFKVVPDKSGSPYIMVGGKRQEEHAQGETEIGPLLGRWRNGGLD